MRAVPMSSEAYSEQIVRYARLLKIRTGSPDPQQADLQLSIDRMPVPVFVAFCERQNPLLGKGLEVTVAQFVIHMALTTTMARPFIEKSRDIATCWGVAVEVRDAPAEMVNFEPLAEYHADLRITLPARAVDLETFAWIINQMVCAYVDLMGVPAQPTPNRR